MKTAFRAAVLPAVLLGSLLCHAASGSIHPLAIEIDVNANLYPARPAVGVAGAAVPCAPAVNGPILNPGATADWVADCEPNTDVDPDPSDNIAVGVVGGVTGAAAQGHWNGVRIVDGIASDDQDIFLTGGKENDTSTWNVGPGSVGSSKYDITQAYLANNQGALFFGMERRGHNGTTAFDFEFNAVGTSGTYVPTRTVGDVLFTFEMQGSGNTGSATPHVFRWNGSAYVELAMPAGLLSSINSSEVPAAPWGYVDSRGDWVLGNLPRFEFAEALVPLGSIALPGTGPCGGRAFVQVRTRSSASATSDLKDTTRIFEFVFGGPTAGGELDVTCDQQVLYSATGSSNTSGGSDGLSFAWTFVVPEGVTLSGTGVTGPDEDGAYHSALESGTLEVALPDGADGATLTALLTVTEGATCRDDSEPLPIDVPRALVATAQKVAADGAALAVLLAGDAPGAEALQWQRLAADWVDVAGANSSTLVYASFESDDPATDPVGLFFDGDSYSGKQWAVALRLHAERTLSHPDGSVELCAADSPPVVVKKVTAVDP